MVLVSRRGRYSMSNPYPSTNMAGSTAVLKFEAKLYHLWIAHNSVVDRPEDRRRCTPLPRLPLRDRVTAVPPIKCTDPEIAAYLKRVHES